MEATNSDNSAGHQVNSEIHIIRVANMEDRHSISEPRPVFCRGNSLPPVWEIDVVRDGTVVIDTFKLDNEVLPPRRNKKGKVVWRLPDSVEKLVGPVRFFREELGQFEQLTHLALININECTFLTSYSSWPANIQSLATAIFRDRRQAPHSGDI